MVDRKAIVKQARAFDAQAQAALASEKLAPAHRRRVLALARARAAKMGSWMPTHLHSQAVRALLADTRPTIYSDVLNGRKGSSATVLGWVRAWEAAGLLALDANAILGLGSPVKEDEP